MKIVKSRRPGNRSRRLNRIEGDPPGSHTYAPDVSVGQAVRELRAQLNYSIRQLAQESGVSVNTLSLIENNRTSPTVSTLQQLAGALGVPIAAFFDRGLSKRAAVHTRAGQGRHAAFSGGIIAHLGAGFADSTVEPLWVTPEPGAGSGSQPIVHGGYEFVFVLKGRISYWVEETAYLLRERDSLLFESRLPHHWQNVAGTSSQFLLVFYATEMNEHATHRHFAMKR